MGKLIGGMILGALVGVVVVMILAPQSGPQLQDTLRSRWAEIMDEGQRAAAERRAELEAEFAEVKRGGRTAV